MSEREIPEDVFRREFGGEDIRRGIDERRSEQVKGLAANGILLLLVGPGLLAAVAVVVVTLLSCRWGMGC